ncbi:MAG: DNA primase [Fimbriimonadaceae bacterium]|nr:DNA primase [Fimbriimonadaceae bacterium]QYK57107.1 MAG: DNA primase [Fimbriimonadaceae bacterium]
MDDVDRVRSRANLVDLVRQRVALKKVGRTWKGLCPFHDDRNPSFQVDQETGRYRCWSCGAKGDSFDWVMQTDKVDFAEALRILAALTGVELTRRQGEKKTEVEQWLSAMEAAQDFFQKQFALSATAREYCQARGLDADTVAQWGLGYAPDVNAALATVLQKAGHSLADCRKLFLVEADSGGGYYDRFRGRLMFPIHDERGRLVAFGGRILGDGHPKYVNSGDTPLFSKSRVLYGLDRAKPTLVETQTAVLVEGYLDVIACHRAGVTGALASLGTSLTEEHAKLLRRWAETVVVLYDSDTAGQKASERACEVLRAGGLKVRVAVLPEGDDPDTLLRRDGPQAVLRAVEQPVSELQYRLVQAERRHGHTSQEFWTEAAKALVEATDPMERAGEVDRLVARYPFTADRASARRAVEELIRAEAAKSEPQGSTPRTSARGGRRAFRPRLHMEMTQAEAAILRSLLSAQLRQRAWETCLREDIFFSAPAAKIAESVRRAFPDQAPEGEPPVWLSKLDPDDAARLTDLVREMHLSPSKERLLAEHETFDGAMEILEEKLESRKRQTGSSAAVVDMDAFREYSARLRAAKGEPQD